MEVIQECNKNTFHRRQSIVDELNILTERQTILERKKEKLIRLILNDVLDEQDVSSEMKKIKQELSEVNTAINVLNIEQEALTNQEVPDEVLRKISYTWNSIQSDFGLSVNDWPFDIKRKLIEWFFGIGKQYGVFIKGTKDEQTYTIRSSLGILAFGWIGDECDAGVTGSIPHFSSISDFSSIINHLQPPDDFETKQHAGTGLKPLNLPLHLMV